MSFEITIAIPVYNRYISFEEAIESALNQETAVNILVVDNNSDHDKFSKYVKSLNNERVSYIRNSVNLGMVENWNVCIEKCVTPWLTILHDDDWLHPKFTEISEKLIGLYPKAKCITAICRVGQNINSLDFDVSKDSNIISLGKNSLLYDNLSPFPGVLFNVSIVKELKGFDPAMYPSSDLDLWMKIVRIHQTIKILMPLSFYRISDAQTTNNVINEIIMQSEIIRAKFYNGFFLRKLVSHYNLYKIFSSYRKFPALCDLKTNNIDRSFNFFNRMKKVKLLEFGLDLMLKFFRRINYSKVGKL
mgnify:CR=1 FL=1